MMKVLRILAGIVLVIIGVIGLLIPVMPQWPFIIPGLMLLSPHFPPAKRLLDWIQRKFPFTKRDWFAKTPSAKMDDR